MLMRSEWFVSGVALAALFLALPYPHDPVTVAIAVPVLLGMIAVGARAAAAVGIPRLVHASVSRGWLAIAITAFAIGLGLGTTLLLLLRFVIALLEPRIVERLARDAAVPLWRWAIILFHAPVLEEVMFRLFVLSLLAWGLAKLPQFRVGNEPQGMRGVVVANLLAALGFAAIHLPAWYQAGPVPIPLLLSVIGLNTVAGYVCGAVYINYGLACAVLTHLGGDIALHLGGRVLA